MINQIILIGRLTRDPELKYTPNGTAVATMSLAVERRKAKGAEKAEADFIDLVAWRHTAEFAANYGTKGRLTVIVGRLQSRSYETKEGQKRKVLEAVVDDLKFLDKGSDSGSGGRQKPTGDEGYDPGHPGIGEGWNAPGGGATIDPWDDIGSQINLDDMD